MPSFQQTIWSLPERGVSLSLHWVCVCLYFHIFKIFIILKCEVWVLVQQSLNFNSFSHCGPDLRAPVRVLSCVYQLLGTALLQAGGEEVKRGSTRTVVVGGVDIKSAEKLLEQLQECCLSCSKLNNRPQRMGLFGHPSWIHWKLLCLSSQTNNSELPGLILATGLSLWMSSL